ncbi:unnamed protein product [Lactuca virosa]|uniref:Uncharacterized protein n=1 Tax=Lactuca virosa TaxID=75947 RepID=A0AAU9M9R2_9ASTR|nr:unnamed protein product [Lactuca virosa]
MFFGAYRNAYKYPLRGMNGSNMWPSTSFIPPLPPLKRKMPGRPKVNRRKDPGEKTTRHTVSKVGRKFYVVCVNKLVTTRLHVLKLRSPKNSSGFPLTLYTLLHWSTLQKQDKKANLYTILQVKPLRKR